MNKLLSQLKKHYKIYAPVLLKNKGRFSDTDLVGYGEIAAIEEVVFHQKSYFSPKEIYYPINQTLFYFTEDEYQCPTAAWTRGSQYFRIVIMGRTGKKNPRIARSFLEWVDRDTVLKVCANLYTYIDKYIDRSLPKEHVGYIVDRTGLNVFKEHVLAGVTLPPKAKVAGFIDFGGYMYDRNNYLE